LYPDELEADFQQYYHLDVAILDPAKAARLLFQLPRECRTYAKLAPASQWGWSEIMANKMVYLLETLVWMKTKDATKKPPQNRPKPFIPDFMAQPKTETDPNEAIEAHTTDDIKDILSRPRE